MSKKLITNIKKLRLSPIEKKINERLSEFSSFKDKDKTEWFSELCFCILTANSKAKTAINIQNELKAEGFCNYSSDKVKSCIIKNKHRFHNNKTRFIVDARQHGDIKKIITNLAKESEISAREWLVKNIKGIGYKESSHFLRNVGYFNFAILDRHILRVMKDEGIISEIPKPISPKKYIQIEKEFLNLAKKMKMSAAELDFYMWYLRTGEVLK
jgi:N-glycosylase/DNA lyase